MCVWERDVFRSRQGSLVQLHPIVLMSPPLADGDKSF